MGTATEVLDQLLYAVAVGSASSRRASARELRPADGRGYFHAMSAYSRRFGRFRYLTAGCDEDAPGIVET
jgi:hypothetical protein